MNVRHIEHFIAIVEHGGYRAAAAALGVTQPALTKAVASLEADLGVTLLTRSRGKAAAVTVFGREIYERGLKLLEDIGQTRRSIELLRDGYSGDVRIGFGAAMSPSRIADIAYQLQAKLPESMIHIRTGLQHQLLPQLRSNRLDFLITSAGVGRSAEDFVFIPLWRDLFKVFVGKSHPLAEHDVYDVRWSAEFPWLSSERLIATDAQAKIFLGHSAKTISPSQLDVFDPAIVAQILAKGRYLSAWPSHSFDDVLSKGTLHALTIPPIDGAHWISETNLVYRKGVPTSTAVQTAWRLVQNMDFADLEALDA